jgi:YggT family protein
LDALILLLQIYVFVLFGRLILSWFPHPPDWARPIYAFLYNVTEPVLRPVRGLVPPLRIGAGALDWSPIIIFVALQILIQILQAQNR